MPDVTIAKVAVSGIPFRLDRPYDYAIPAELAESVALAPVSAFEKLKPIDRVLDEAPILTPAPPKKTMRLLSCTHVFRVSSLFTVFRLHFLQQLLVLLRR